MLQCNSIHNYVITENRHWLIHKWPLFHENLDKLAPGRLNQSGF